MNIRGAAVLDSDGNYRQGSGVAAAVALVSACADTDAKETAILFNECWLSHKTQNIREKVWGEVDALLKSRDLGIILDNRYESPPRMH